MPRLRHSNELNNELDANISVGGFPTETYMPRGGQTPLTRPSLTIIAEAISRVASPIGRRPAARDGNELALPHHVGKVASHRPLANASHPLANRRSWKRAITSNKIVDDALYLSTSTVASGPTDGPASLHARCGAVIVLTLRHVRLDRRCRHERDKPIAVLQDRVLPCVEPRKLVEAPRSTPQLL